MVHRIHLKECQLMRSDNDGMRTGWRRARWGSFRWLSDSVDSVGYSCDVQDVHCEISERNEHGGGEGEKP